MQTSNKSVFRFLFFFLATVILLSLITAAYFLGQITAKKQLTQNSSPSQNQTTQKSPGTILLNPVLNVSQNKKYMELLNLDNQIISLLGTPYLQANPTASFLKPYTQGVNPQESQIPTLKESFTRRDTLIKDLGLVKEEN
jgi:hypothetical protein